MQRDKLNCTTFRVDGGQVGRTNSIEFQSDGRAPNLSPAGFPALEDADGGPREVIAIEVEGGRVTRTWVPEPAAELDQGQMVHITSLDGPIELVRVADDDSDFYTICTLPDVEEGGANVIGAGGGASATLFRQADVHDMADTPSTVQLIIGGMPYELYIHNDEVRLEECARVPAET